MKESEESINILKNKIKDNETALENNKKEIEY